MRHMQIRRLDSPLWIRGRLRDFFSPLLYSSATLGMVSASGFGQNATRYTQM